MDRIILQHHSEAIGGGLRWCESLGLAFQDDMSRSVEYGEDYFAKHAVYKGTPISDRIQAARIGLVDRTDSDAVFDIGIGSGTFLDAYAECGRSKTAGGYDVNPRAIEWLRERSLFVDPYRDELPADVRICWTLWDVLEHLRNPHELLDRIRVGDSLCVTVPIYHDLRREVFASKHYRPDEHYYYFTPAGLVRWLGADNYGFELLEANRLEQLAGREGVASFAFRKVAPTPEVVPAKRAFIVCGPESSGNRVLGAILCRAGCWGSGSTEQPLTAEVPDNESLVMLIKHHDLLATFQTLARKGYETTAILLVREWVANVASLVARGHDTTPDAAEARIRNTLLSNLCDAVTYRLPLLVTTYESLGDGSLPRLLERLRLRTDNLDRPLELRGQERPDQSFFPTPLAENAKHYRN